MAHGNRAGRRAPAEGFHPAMPIRHSDLRGAARLATDATAGLTDLVEALHARIARVRGLGAFSPRAPEGRTGGITGLVYRSIRGVTRASGWRAA